MQSDIPGKCVGWQVPKESPDMLLTYLSGNYLWDIYSEDETQDSFPAHRSLSIAIFLQIINNSRI